MHASLLAHERLEMESLILANAAAVAEVRKHAKADDKESKGWSFKSAHGDAPEKASNPSITSTGIVRELVQRDPGQTTNKGGVITQVAPEAPYKLTTNDGYAVVPIVFPSLTPQIDDSKGSLEASTQDRADVINQLLALWSPKVSIILPINGVAGVQHQRPDLPAGMKEITVEEQVEETVELFPKRSRPY